jgi:hypothetical protein
MMRKLVTLVAVGLSSLAPAQAPATIDGRAVVTIANDKLTLALRTEGGAMVRLVMNDDPAAINPMHTGLGHFVCVDGFGPVSAEEQAAGLPGHGEAHRVPWTLVSSDKTGTAPARTTTVSF